MKNLKTQLKELIITECEKDVDINSILDDEPLFGANSNLQLDSLDALQISMALQKRYQISITDSKKLRLILANINSLAKYIQENSHE